MSNELSDQSEQNLISDINTLLNQSGLDTGKLRKLEEALEGQDQLPEVVVKHLVNILSDSDERTLNKLWIVLDYLSSKCPQKLISLTESEDFLEKVSFLIWDADSRQTILSLVKYWSMKFTSLNIPHENLKTLISKLIVCDAQLPEKLDLIYCEDPNEKKTSNDVAIPIKISNFDETTLNDTEKSNDPFNNIMTYEELKNYKIEKCKLGDSCPNFPGNQTGGKYRNESVSCMYYHGPSDKRRIFVRSDSQDVRNSTLTYTAKLCQQDNCKIDDCNASHNFFEYMYHPINYKRYRCIQIDPPACLGGRFCPYYHELEEKGFWNLSLDLYLNMKRDANEAFDSDDVGIDSGDIFGPSAAGYRPLHDTPYNGNMQQSTHYHHNHQEQHHNQQQSAEKSAKQANDSESTITYVPSYFEVKGILRVPKSYIDPRAIKELSLAKLIPSPVSTNLNTKENGEISTGELIDVKKPELSDTLEGKYDTSKLFNPTQLLK